MSEANFVLLYMEKPRDFGGIAQVSDIAAENTLCPSACCPACLPALWSRSRCRPLRWLALGQTWLNCCKELAARHIPAAVT